MAAFGAVVHFAPASKLSTDSRQKCVCVIIKLGSWNFITFLVQITRISDEVTDWETVYAW